MNDTITAEQYRSEAAELSQEARRLLVIAVSLRGSNSAESVQTLVSMAQTHAYMARTAVLASQGKIPDYEV